MQTRIAACGDGIVKNFANTTANGVTGQCLFSQVTRRRGISARKPSAFKYKQDLRSERQITPAAYELAEEKFSQVHKLNSSARRALFHAVQCLVQYNKEHGARLGLKIFTSPHTGRVIQDRIVECGLASCVDLDIWKPKGGDVRKAKARGYIPCFNLLWANIGSGVVSSLAEYERRKVNLRKPLHTEHILFRSCEMSGVTIPANVARAFQLGTGLFCDKATLYKLVTALPVEKWPSTLGAALAATGYDLGNIINPVWEQNTYGRIHANRPGAINMPTALLGALQSIDRLPLWCVDFSNFELRIACQKCEQEPPQGDCYGVLGLHCGLDRSTVKAVVNPFLHGQKLRQIRHGKGFTPDKLQNRLLVEAAIQDLLPRLYANLTRIQRDSAILQRSGASVFFPCISAAMACCEIKHVGLPKHDGWVFAATEDQACSVRATMEAEATRLTGIYFPAKLDRLSC